MQITPTVNGANADITVKTRIEGKGEIEFSILDAAGAEVLTGKGCDAAVTLAHPHLWDGVRDPYLYTCAVRLVLNGAVQDEVRQRFGVRSFHVDPQKGFFLNGRAYPLHGVSRHQDRKGLGNAITREMHDEDMQLIKELGANTIRLAHYQHDQYFYDLCDEAGMVVWAEIPYISEHMPNGRENTISQMKELIVQNYNHACIVCWGVSNEITISTKDKRDMLDNHRVLNDLCHEMDKTRLTTLACYAMCGPFNPVAHITDLVSWNLYLGWYVPGLFLNDLWMDFSISATRTVRWASANTAPRACPTCTVSIPAAVTIPRNIRQSTMSTCCAALNATAGCGRPMYGTCTTLLQTPAIRAASRA